MPKKIPLTQGKFAIVDKSDFELLSMFKWSAHRSRGGIWYAERAEWVGTRCHVMAMHRFIIDAPDTIQVDHRDNNGLNNQRCNLRLCLNGQNKQNSRKNKSASSKYKGVVFYPQISRWRARITKDKVPVHLGYFQSQYEAACSYDQAAREIFGEFAHTNFSKK